MKIHRIGITILMCIIVVLSACSNAETDSEVVNKSEIIQSDDLTELRKESEHFEFYYTESDEECLEDLVNTLEENYTKITTDLKTDLGFKVKLHVYKDIDAFHKAAGKIGAPAWVVGTAYGNGIQMVSPLSPGPMHSKQSMIQVAVHEFTHVVINNIAKSWTIPMWLHEGTAMYEAEQTYSLNGIEELVRTNKIPSIEVLEPYDSPELMEDNRVYPFSYTLVEYIISEYGIEKLNDLIRSPYDYNNVFGSDKVEFEQNWKDYLKAKYDKY